jgi:Pyridoxamine 5'-phosphate oxidase/Cupin domain
MHLTPVWYLFEDDCLFVETAASDRKVRNILARPAASLLVDSRKQGAERWVRASGTAEIICGERSKAINAKIQQRYLTQAGLEDPRVGPVLAAASEVTIGLTPHAWRSFDLERFDEQWFGGLLGQSHETEVFYILEGQFEVTVGGQKVAAPAGAMVVGPWDIPYTFRNVGPATGKLLLTIIPGHFADYFLEMEGVPDHDRAAIEALSAKYGVVILE